LNSSFTKITDNGEDLAWPATKAKDLNGNELILDTDADTSITADTDDRIDFRVQGEDLFVMDGTVASAVDGLEFKAAATASPSTVTVTAQGSSTNINIDLVSKGTGVVQENGNPIGGLGSVVEDTTPQYGGEMDTNEFSINFSEGATIASDYTFDFATTDVNTGADLITETAHLLAVNVKGQFTTTGTLPAGLSLATDYFIISAGFTVDTFKVSLTEAGSVVDITDQGTGTHTFTRVSGAMNIWRGDGNTVHVSGTVGIDDFTDAPRIGARRVLILDGILQITSGSGITVFGGTVTSAAGDELHVYADAIDAFDAFLVRADGTATVAGAGGGGAWNIIGTTVASGASVTITGLDSTFDTYAIGVSDMVNSNDAIDFRLRVGDSGGVDSGASDYVFHIADVGEDSGSYSSDIATASFIKLTGTPNAGNDTGSGLGAMLFLHRPQDGTTFPRITGTCMYADTGTKIKGGFLVSQRQSAISLDRIEVSVSAGTMVGRVTVWGIAHA